MLLDTATFIRWTFHMVLRSMSSCQLACDFVWKLRTKSVLYDCICKTTTTLWISSLHMGKTGCMSIGATKITVLSFCIVFLFSCVLQDKNSNIE